MVAADTDIKASAVVCLGYPLKVNMRVFTSFSLTRSQYTVLCYDNKFVKYNILQGTKGAIRDEPLMQLSVPTMFVQVTNECRFIINKGKFVKDRI